MQYLYSDPLAKYALHYGLKPADRIIEPIFETGFSKHHIIYLGRDENGIEWISENKKFTGVRFTMASDYFQPGKIYTIQKFCGDESQRTLALNRALSSIGRPYDLIVSNCEHYASFVQTGKAESVQVKNGLLLAGGIFLFALLMN